MTQISTPSGDIHPRNPWFASLLSLALPGLGQFYNGDLNKALWMFLGFVLIGCFPGVTIAALYVPAVLMLPLLLIIGNPPDHTLEGKKNPLPIPGIATIPTRTRPAAPRTPG